MREFGGMQCSFGCVALLVCSSSLTHAVSHPNPEEHTLAFIVPNRQWDILPPVTDESSQRQALRQACVLLNGHTIHLAGITIDWQELGRILKENFEEPLPRLLREFLRRPVDVEDFLLFLDDILLARHSGLPKEIHVPAGRARVQGILLHPDDVFRGKPRLYGTSPKLDILPPERPAKLAPAKDGDILGPRWSARYVNPFDEKSMLAELAEANADGDFADRVALLLEQLRAQGADVYLTSTLRRRERGYLMWGAFMLSRKVSAASVVKAVNLLQRLNTRWQLHVPIVWSHPDGWQHTVEAARQMKEAYDVVYATQRGAQNSDHYDGTAADFVAVGLPRSLALTAPNGASKMFDLSAADEPRDISLSPGLIAWIEKNFQMRKLKSDYPHWNDHGLSGKIANTPRK